jgi:hypothetical protein
MCAAADRCGGEGSDGSAPGWPRLMNPETMAVTWSTRLHNIPLPEPILVAMGCGLVAHRLRPWRLPGPEVLRRAAGWCLVGAGCTLNVVVVGLRACRARGPAPSGNRRALRDQP